MVGKDVSYYSPPLDIPVRGVQGAGDAMVAGLAAELLASFTSTDTPAPDVLLKSAMAAAAASLIREGTLMATKEGYEEMLQKVYIENIT
jgi:1-phosphofructokinase